MANYYIQNEDGGYQLLEDGLPPGYNGPVYSGRVNGEDTEFTQVDPRVVSDPAVEFGEPGSLEYSLAKYGRLGGSGLSSPQAVADMLRKSGAPKDYDWTEAISKAYDQQVSQFKSGFNSAGDDPGQAALKIIAQTGQPWAKDGEKAVRAMPEFEQGQKQGAAGLEYSNSQDDGFMGTGIPTPIAAIAIGMLLGPAGLQFGQTLAGGAGLTANAINGAVTSILTGSNPLTGAATSFLGGSLMEGLGNGPISAEDFAAAMGGEDAMMGQADLAGAGQDYGTFLDKMASGSGSAIDALTAGVGGVSTDAGQMLMAGGNYGGTTDVQPIVDGPLQEQVGGVSTDANQVATGGTIDAPTADQVLTGNDPGMVQTQNERILAGQDAEYSSPGQTDANNVDYTQPGAPAASGGPSGASEKYSTSDALANEDAYRGSSALDYSGKTYGQFLAETNPDKGFLGELAGVLKGNKELAVGGVLAGGGLISGAMNNAAANERLDKTIDAQSNLQTQKVNDQLALDAGKKAAVQSGSYFDANIKMRPKSNVLRRPDGSFVYATPGIIAGQMRG